MQVKVPAPLSLNVNPLIEQAKTKINSWNSSEPRELALAVASLCRLTLDSGGLPTGDADWRAMRAAFDVQKGQGIAETIVSWDEWCRTADVDVSNDESFVKLGIVTWVVKFLARWLGMVAGSEPISDFDEWKSRLCKVLDEHIIVR